MWLNTFQNITQMFLVQNAIGRILDQIGTEIDAHAVCLITNGTASFNNLLHLNEFPTVICDCQISEIGVTSFVDQIQQGVTSGCSYFVATAECALLFINNFRIIHDWIDQKYEKKVFVVIDPDEVLTYPNILDILRHETVINDLPLTLVLQPNVDNEWIDTWSAYPYRSSFKIVNRFFLSNFSFQIDKRIIPNLTDLYGLPVTGAFIHYPPYAAYYRVPPGTGNANLYNSNESLSVRLDGQEHLILVELCLKYNCTLTARLDYDEELWGEIYQNQTGTGLLGALAMYHTNVTCAAVCLWDNTYEFTQYSPQVQRATVTHILPKPLPLPYWETPILPFPGYVWVYVIGSLSIGAIKLFIVNGILGEIEKKQVEKTENEIHTTFGLFDSIFAVFMMSIFQTVNINTKYFSNVTIFVVILIFALVIGNLYCSGLASVMTITRYEEPVDTLLKLLGSNLLWGSTSFAWTFLIEESEYPPHQKYVQKFIVKPIPEMLKLTQQRKLAVTLEIMQHGSLSYQPYIDEETSKHYMIMKEPMYWQATIIMASKTWPFMEQLNRIVLMQQESGIRYYWEHGSSVRTLGSTIQRNFEENSRSSQGGEPIKLSVEHILGAIFLLLLGSTVATIAFFLEMICYHNKNKLAPRK